MRVYVDALSRIPTVSAGSQAFIIASMQIVEKYFGKTTFVFLSSDESFERYYCNQYDFDIEILQRSDSQSGTAKNILDITKTVDFVVSPWGDGYISTPPHNIFQKTFFLKWYRKPLILFPSSIGPFSGRIKRIFAKRGLKRFDAVMARDVITYKYLSDLKIPNLYFVPDSAFVLEPCSTERLNEILGLESIQVGKTYIGINVSQLLNNFYSTKLNKDYPKLIADLTNYLAQKTGAQILLIPHQIYPKSCSRVNPKILSSVDGDDRYPIKQAMKYIKGDTVTPILGDYTPSDYKGIIALCDIFIGGRMHTVIGSTSQGIPSLLMQYSHKALGVMETLGLQKYVWDYKADPKILYELIDDLYLNRDNLRKSLASKAQEIKQNAWKAGEIAYAVVEKRA